MENKEISNRIDTVARQELEGLRNIDSLLNKLLATIDSLHKYGSVVYFGGIIIGLMIFGSFTETLSVVPIICLTIAGCVIMALGVWIWVIHFRDKRDTLRTKIDFAMGQMRKSENFYRDIINKSNEESSELS